MLEYEDYCQHPTIGNASEFITQALERNLDMAAMKENYVDYLANRPRVERIGEYGLFTDAGKLVVLAQVQREASEHKGPIWPHVISLRRENEAEAESFSRSCVEDIRHELEEKGYKIKNGRLRSRWNDKKCRA